MQAYMGSMLTAERSEPQQTAMLGQEPGAGQASHGETPMPKHAGISFHRVTFSEDFLKAIRTLPTPMKGVEAEKVFSTEAEFRVGLGLLDQVLDVDSFPVEVPLHVLPDLLRIR